MERDEGVGKTQHTEDLVLSEVSGTHGVLERVPPWVRVLLYLRRVFKLLVFLGPVGPHSVFCLKEINNVGENVPIR